MIEVINNSYVKITHNKLKDRVFEVWGVDLVQTLEKMSTGAVHSATFKQYTFHIRNGYIIVSDQKTKNEIVLTHAEIRDAINLKQTKSYSDPYEC